MLRALALGEWVAGEDQECRAVDSTKFEHGCRVAYAGLSLLSLLWVWMTDIFQLSGFYSTCAMGQNS